MYQNGYVPPKPSGERKRRAQQVPTVPPQMMDSAAHGVRRDTSASSTGYGSNGQAAMPQGYRQSAGQPASNGAAQYVGQSAPQGAQRSNGYAAGYQRPTYRLPQTGS